MWAVLLVLLVLEILELTVRFHEVETVCKGARRFRKERHPDWTPERLDEAEKRCATISDAYDYGMESLTIFLLAYLQWIVHSAVRLLRAAGAADDAAAAGVQQGGAGVAPAVEMGTVEGGEGVAVANV